MLTKLYGTICLKYYFSISAYWYDMPTKFKLPSAMVYSVSQVLCIKNNTLNIFVCQEGKCFIFFVYYVNLTGVYQNFIKLRLALFKKKKNEKKKK